MAKINRRTFLKNTALAAAGAMALPVRLRAAEQQSQIIVVHGKDPGLMLAKGVQKLGTWSRWIEPGSKVTLKPNAAWAATPESAANTNPELVDAFMRGCNKAGAKEIVVCENTCSPHLQSFKMSGIQDAVEDNGGRMYRPVKGSQFRKVSIPQGRNLQEAEVPKDVLDTDCLVNMPVAKSHGGATLTIAMKNWMGSVKDRGFWHRNDLHQCIADFSTFIKPQLHIVDATRVMLTNGPRGPGKVDTPEQIILGFDPVAIDAYTTTLFDLEPFDVRYIRLAHEMGIGCGDLSRVEVSHITV